MLMQGVFSRVFSSCYVGHVKVDFNVYRIITFKTLGSRGSSCLITVLSPQQNAETDLSIDSDTATCKLAVSRVDYHFTLFMAI